MALVIRHIQGHARRASCHAIPGGTAVSDLAGLEVAQDALGTLPPQGPGAPRPQREHPRESSGRRRETTENVAWGGDQPVERQKEKEGRAPGVK